MKSALHKLSVLFVSALLLAHAAAGSGPTPVKQGLGAYHWGANYRVNASIPSIVDGAQQVQALGSQYIALALSYKYTLSNPYNSSGGFDYTGPASDWGTQPINNLTDLAKSPPFQQVFQMPFKVYTLTAFPFSDEDYLGNQNLAAEQQEITNLVTYLLTTYQGTGKIFIVKNWEGDNALSLENTGGYPNISSPAAYVPPPAALVTKMINWLNVRHQGVLQGRINAGSVSGVAVYDAAEFNLVDPVKWSPAKSCMLSNVIPSVQSDYIDYSSYDTINGPATANLAQGIASDVSLIQTFLGGRPLMIGEFGFSTLNFPDADTRTQVAAQAFLAAGCPYVMNWEIEDGAGGGTGFQLVNPNGSHTAQWTTLHNMLVAGNHTPAAQAQSISTPANTAVTITLGATDADNDILTFSLSANPAHGTVSAVNGNQITYTPNNNFSGSDSFGFVANDGLTSSSPATISITVGPVPVPNLSAAPSALTFSATAGGANPSAQSVTLSNTGTAASNWSVSSDAAWLSALPINGSIAAGTNSGPVIAINAAVGPLTPNTYIGHLTFKDQSSVPQGVTVTFIVTTPLAPNLSLNTNTFIFSTPSGGSNPAPQFVTLSNTGTTASNWNVTSDAAWLTAFPINGSIAAGTNPGPFIAVNAIVGSLAPNTYIGHLTFTDQSGIPHVVTITFIVTVPLVPNLSVVPSALTFSATAGGASPPAQSVTLINAGTAVSNWNVTSDAAWLTALPINGSIPAGINPGPAIMVNAAVGSLTPNTYIGHLTFIDQSGAPHVVAVTFNVSAAPTPNLSVSPNALTFSATSGGTNPAVPPVTLSNTGTAASNWSVTSDAVWLTALPINGSITAGANPGPTITVNTTVGSLMPNTYIGHLTFTDQSGTSHVVTATFIVTAPLVPNLSANTNTLTFNATTGGGNPSAQSVTLSNTGTAASNWSVTSDAVWLTALPINGSIPTGTHPGPAIAVNATVGSLTPNTYTGHLTFTDQSGTPKSVTTTFIVTSISPTRPPAPDLSDIQNRTYTLNDTLSLTYNSPASGFNWEFTPLNGSVSIANGSTLTGSASLLGTPIPTPAPRLSLATLSLLPGQYTVQVQALNNGQTSAWASATITLISTDLITARVHPNPFRAARGDTSVTFDQLTADSTIKIFTVSGRWVKTLQAPTGSTSWDLATDAGDKAASGLYLYLVEDSQGHTTRGKLALIR